MKNFPLFFFGIFVIFASSWVGLILTPHLQYGNLKTISEELDEETLKAISGDTLFPRSAIGHAEKGKKVYQSLGCITCHTQQVQHRQKNPYETFSADFLRGYGERPSVARDYIRQKKVSIGYRRIGQDLMDVGSRLEHPTDVYAYLSLQENEGKTNIKHPRYPFLFKKQSSNNASSVPNRKAVLLADYLMHLRLDYKLPEVRWEKEKKKKQAEKNSRPKEH